MSEHIIYHIADGIATLTLNRPKVLNAINYDLLKELDELLDQAAACLLYTSRQLQLFNKKVDEESRVQITFNDPWAVSL